MAVMQKTICNIGRQEFNDNAKPIEVVIDGQKLVALPKNFSTGSFGYYLSQKTPVQVNGKAAVATLQVQLVLVGSKEV